MLLMGKSTINNKWAIFNSYVNVYQRVQGDTKMMAVRETNSLVRLTKFCIILMGTSTYSFMFTMCGKCGGGTIIYSMGLV